MIKGAVELLRKQLNPIEESVLRPLDRIQRQVINMENIIETLLWLSRENEVIDPGPPFDVSSVTHETVEQNRHFIAGKPVDIDFTAEGDPRLSIPVACFPDCADESHPQCYSIYPARHCQCYCA